MQGALEALSSLESLTTLTKEEFLEGLLRSEIEYRERRRAQRRLSQAKFPTEKEWSDIDMGINTEIQFEEIQKLSKGEFIPLKKNIAFLGQQGTGKTHSLVALGRELCRNKITVKFYTACALVNELEEAKSNHKLSSLMKNLLKPELLIIDELGFVPFSENGARLLFDVFTNRYERGSIAISSNLSFEKWVQIFGTVELTAALIDRFTHNCVTFTYMGQSVRLLQAKKRSW
ncbi:MAG: IS21-like element helper ATPase IstB [Flavobacteriaceae bacterium]|nr:IS21-like element helper ATPase IstB [Flavobacteriaceae bacterium]